MSAVSSSCNPGSSPRVRGAVVLADGTDSVVGIIPACAGSSSARLWGGDVEGNHPRACGEQLRYISLVRYRLGSSPRMRRAVAGASAYLSKFGIIPAHAGSSFWLGGVPDRGRDHPRVCGEQWRRSLMNVYIGGSSPCVRGAERRPDGVILQPGIIPARAGNSLSKTLASPE